MIRLYRGEIPDALLSSSVMQAKTELRESFYNKNIQQRMQFNPRLLAGVRHQLIALSNHKCAYCESALNRTGSGEIDNFRPKSGARGLNPEDYSPSHYWWLAYEWDNLLMACQICNTKYKRDFFPLESEALRAPLETTGPALAMEQPLLIDPSLEDPAEHLDFDENGYVHEFSKKGKVTIEILGLNRHELVIARAQAIQNLKLRLDTIGMIKKKADEGKKLLAYIDSLFSDNPDQEYAAFLRAVFESWHEKNAASWENYRKHFTRQHEEKRYAKTANSYKTEQADEINAVSRQMDAIKRFSIKSVKITNFKSLKDVTLDLLPGDTVEKKEAWMLLLGDNGIGKSSILQAITLALCGGIQLRKMQPDPLDFLRHKAKKGSVVIYSYESDMPVTLRFDRHGFTSSIEEPPTFIMSYGSTRLLPKGGILPAAIRPPYLDIANLFDYSVALNNPVDWLSKVAGTEFNERVAPAFFDILALRGDDKLEVKKGTINIRQSGVDNELDDNSDGYKTITALVAQIMQTLSLDKANYHNSHGIVMIDEIGNHLHPRWRMKIAAALRRAFPKLQFIVTTHEPLCLRGLNYGEVIVLIRDEKNSIRTLDSTLLPDHSSMSIEQLLTSDLFGLIDVNDEQAEKRYEEYYKLLSKKDRNEADEEELKSLSSLISKKEMLGDTLEDQVFYKVIDETVGKLLQEGFTIKEQLKDETVKIVRDILSERKISDWL